MRLENIKRLNRKLTEATAEEQDELPLISEALNGLFDKSNKNELSEKTAGLLLTYKKSPEYLKMYFSSI